MNLKIMQIIGFIFTVIVGSLLHFTYKWLGENAFVGLFSAVNESTWEHLKLLFVPMLVYAIFEYFIYGRTLGNFFQVRFLSIILGMAVIVVGVYTYSGIIGRNILIVDILLFIAAVYTAYRFSFKMLMLGKYSSSCEKGLAILGVLVLLAGAAIFTYAPPEINLFLDPVTNTYGILQNNI